MEATDWRVSRMNEVHTANAFGGLASTVDRLLDQLDVGAFTPYMMDFG